MSSHRWLKIRGIDAEDRHRRGVCLCDYHQYPAEKGGGEMENYQTPEMEVVLFDAEDVIATSGPGYEVDDAED
jgi:hypothetical protein